VPDDAVPVPPSLLDHVLRRLLVVGGFGSDWVDTSVGPIHVLSRTGGGPLPHVTLIHGFGANALQWVPLVRALRPHVRGITAVDLPGHGFSVRRPDLSLDVLRDGVLEALDRSRGADDGPRVVVGNSLGGAVAVRYVQARPDHVLGAHLLSPGGAPMDAEELEEVRRLFRVGTHGEALVFLERLFGRPAGWVGHLFAPGVRRTFRDLALHGLLERVTDRDWITGDELRALPRPVRVVWGRADRILPARAVGFWRDQLPVHGELEEPGAFGHVPQLTAPLEAAADILAFARRLVERV
jgi:pimeloyl-ACP methyl ester carboxylesterase